MPRYLLTVLTSLFLIVATLAVYWQVRDHEFINFDDDLYVTENQHVQAGLTLEGSVWAFTSKDIVYWHPLTWLSLMLDYDLYGLNPRGYHLTNLLVHILSTVLLFLVLKRMTGAHWQSAFVASLFALHPLNVDSVAWVAERKNILSTFFWMLTMWAYARYAERPRLNRYLLVLLPFALGLMAKPMLVTLPFVLLLMDYWPLGRLQLGQFSKEASSRAHKSVNCGYQQGALVFRLILEKVPFLALSAVSICVSYFSVQRPGVAVSTETVPTTLRIANALVSYVGYIGKMLWPHNLAVFYPFPEVMPTWQAAVSALFLAVISVLVVSAARWRPYLVVGWLWYIGTLVPVIGLVQAGLWPAMADRFAYVPLIGLFIIMAWGVPDLLTRWRHQRIVLLILAGTVLSALMVRTGLQARYWKNTIALWRHALDVTAGNCVAHTNLGLALAQQGSIDEAISHYSKALQINPGYAQTHINLGAALAQQGSFDEAIRHFSEALRIKPDDLETLNNLGVALERQGNLDEAISHYSKALQIQPDYAKTHNNLGVALALKGSLKEAISHYSKALQIQPDYAEVHNNFGLALARQGSLNEAIGHFSEALRIKADYAEARHNWEACLRLMDKSSSASNAVERAW